MWLKSPILAGIKIGEGIDIANCFAIMMRKTHPTVRPPHLQVL